MSRTNVLEKIVRRDSGRNGATEAPIMGKLIRSITLPLAAAALGLTCLASGPSSATVPILGWHSIPESELSLERFQELAAMGLNHSLMYYSPGGNRKALNFAQQAGVKLFVGDARFHKRGKTLTDAVAQYRDHPALAGYMLRDEPAVQAFPDLAAVRDELKEADPDHWSYVNLLPTYASPAQLGCPTYRGHARRFMLDFRPEVLSFDHYPILEGNRLRQDYYLNLELIRQTALEFATPFWAFALTCPHKPYPMPALSHIRLQTWSNFAYGAKGLQYFTYWTPTPGRWDFHDAPIKRDGTRSATYALLKQFNQDVQTCSEIILKSRVVAVYHTAPLPKGTRGLDASSPFEKVAGGEALLGLHLLPTGERYVLVVNRSFTKRATLTLSPRIWVKRVSWNHKVGGVDFQQTAGRAVTLQLEPGAGAFLLLHWR
jgi:hypothetical protein